MKILIVGQQKEWAIEHHYQRYLAQWAEVEVFPVDDIFDEYYWASLKNKLKVKLGISSIYKKINKAFLEKIATVEPDIVWVFKGMRIGPKALKKAKKMGVLLANYNPDHPFQFSSAGSGNANVTNSIGLFDLHFCYDKRVAERIEKEFASQTAILPFGYELADDVFQKAQAQQEVNAACFIGTCDPIRVQEVCALAAAGIEMHVHGDNWDKMLPAGTANVHIHPPVYGNDYWYALRRYRLQLNIFRPHNIGAHNMRTFEVPAIGGIMLAPDSPDHRHYFEVGEEVFIYRSQEEMIDQAKKILAMSTDQASEVRQNAHLKSITNGYSYEQRARQAAEVFKKKLSSLSSIINHPPSTGHL